MPLERAILFLIVGAVCVIAYVPVRALRTARTNGKIAEQQARTTA